METDIITFEQFVNLLANIGVAAPLVTVFVNLFKAFSPNTDPRLVTGVTSVVYVVGVWLARWTGQTDLFQRASDFGVEFIPLLTQILGTLAGASLIYNAARKNDIPVLGYKPESTSTSHVTPQG